MPAPPPRRPEDRQPRAGRPARTEAARAVGRGRSPGGGRDVGSSRSEWSRTSRPAPDATAGKGWGSVARRGARSMNLAEHPGQERTGPRRDPGEPVWEPERWVADRPAPPTARRARSERPERAASVPRPVVAEMASVAGGDQADRLAQKLADAARAYDHDRYSEALRLLRPLAAAAPSSPSVRELLGLTLYRMGRWRQAIRELEAFVALSGSFDQHPVLEDCHRALGQWRAVARHWDELRRASPSPEVVAEGRIVAAGALADRGDVAGALALLVRPSRKGRPPRPYELRLMYTQADLYERAGETPRARELFRTIVGHDADFADAASRVAALR